MHAAKKRFGCGLREGVLRWCMLCCVGMTSVHISGILAHTGAPFPLSSCPPIYALLCRMPPIYRTADSTFLA